MQWITRKLSLMLLSIGMILMVTVLPVAAQNEIEITSPTSLSTVGGMVEIRGTIVVEGLQNYYFEIAPFSTASTTEQRWTPVTLPSRVTGVDQVLATWDASTVDNGVYTLRLRLLRTNGDVILEEVEPIRVDNTVAQAPTAEPTPEGPIIVPRPDVVNELPLAVGGQLTDFDENAVELMREAGMTWIKWQLPFIVGDNERLIVLARDRINWTHEHGFFAFLSIKGDKDELATMGAATYYPLFAEAVGQVAALQPDLIQIWNEMNLDREWPNGQINPASYVDLLRQSYEAIKAVDPEVIVMTGSPAPTGAEGAFGLNAVWNDDRYYQGMANAGAAQYSDCIGIHYNEGIIPPSQQGGDPRGDYPTYYFPLMIQRAAFPFRNTDASFCFSELGYLSPDGYGTLPAGFAWGANTSVEEQAAWLRDAIRMAGEMSSVQIDLLIVFNVNFTIFVDGDPQGAFAIIRPDGSCLACEEIATLRTPQN